MMSSSTWLAIADQQARYGNVLTARLAQCSPAKASTDQAAMNTFLDLSARMLRHQQRMLRHVSRYAAARFAH